MKNGTSVSKKKAGLREAEKQDTPVIAVILMICFFLTAGILVAYAATTGDSSNTPAYQKQLFGDTFIDINIIADETEWNDMIANASEKTYIRADVIINGTTFQSVGIRTKGNASLSQVSQSASPTRYSLHISFDEYVKGQTCFGLDKLILNNMISDPTYMKEYMSQDLMRFIGVEAPLTNYADISVNGEGFGFYVALEYYGDSYLSRVYNDVAGNLYNVKTMAMGGGAFAGQGGFNQNNQADALAADALAADAPAVADWNDRAGFVGRGGGSSGGTLAYTDDNISSYSAIFDNAHGTVAESDQKKVIEALKNLSEGTNLEHYFDVDAILRYFAAHTVVVNLDSYYSSMAQNYFVLERNGQISILPWDYHLSYGAFQSGSASDVVNAPIDTPVSGVTMESRPLLDVLFSNEVYLAKYHEYLQEIVGGYFNSGLFEQTVRSLQEKIAPYMQQDASALYTYEQFDTGVDALINLNLLRAQSIEGQLDGSIPSTTDGQTAEASASAVSASAAGASAASASAASAWVDASSVDMSALGSNSMGGGMGGDRIGGNRPQMGAGNNVNDADMFKTREAMEILLASAASASAASASADGALSDEQLQQLRDLGFTDDEIEQMRQMSQNGFANVRPDRNGFQQDGNPQDFNADQGGGAQPFPGGMNVSTVVSTLSTTQWVVYGVLSLALLGSILYLALFKRRKLYG